MIPNHGRLSWRLLVSGFRLCRIQGSTLDTVEAAILPLCLYGLGLNIELTTFNSTLLILRLIRGNIHHGVAESTE